MEPISNVELFAASFEHDPHLLAEGTSSGSLKKYHSYLQHQKEEAIKMSIKIQNLACRHYSVHSLEENP